MIPPTQVSVSLEALQQPKTEFHEILILQHSLRTNRENGQKMEWKME